MSSKRTKEVDLPEDIHARLKEAARARKLTTNGLLTQIVREWLELGEAIQRRADRRRCSRWTSFGGSVILV